MQLVLTHFPIEKNKNRWKITLENAKENNVFFTREINQIKMQHKKIQTEK